MATVPTETDLPAAFHDLDAFQNWVRASFDDDATTVIKGRRWRDFLCELIPLTDLGRQYPALIPNEKESNDGGIDAQSDANEDGRYLALQSKLDVSDKIRLDSVLSAFQSFDRGRQPTDDDRLFAMHEDDGPRPVYVIACSNSLDRIIAAYEATNLGSRGFYNTLKAERRIEFLDGTMLLGEMQRLWRLSFSVPHELRVVSAAGWLQSGDVSVGVIAGSELAELARLHGFGLFFENVRDFLGLGKNSDRTTVNEAIQSTARDQPTKMLARNNGIVFRAKAVDPEDEHTLLLHDASIVNGCQTTMCLARLGTPVDESCEIVAKVVCASDAWEVAEAANNQNAIAQIDLKLARFLRKQIAQKAAAEAGVALRNHTELEGVARVIATLRHEETSYEQLRYIYIGLFSSKPNHLWDDNYNRLLEPVLNSLYAIDPPKEQLLFQTLFALLNVTKDALGFCAKLNAEDDPLRRAHDDSRPKYRVYVALLALCTTLGDNLAERSDAAEKEAERMAAFLDQTARLLEDPEGRRKFIRNFTKAYSLLGELALEEHEDDARGRVAQRVAGKLASASFSSLYVRLRRRIETDKLLNDL